MSDHTNRRLNKRVLVDLSCAITLSNGIRIEAIARNLSIKGMFFESSYPLNKGTDVTINFDIPVNGDWHPIEAQSQIQHRATRVSLGEYGVGVHFLEIDEESQAFLQQYIELCPALH